jgi:iron complex outermembrane receptor protein
VTFRTFERAVFGVKGSLLLGAAAGALLIVGSAQAQQATGTQSTQTVEKVVVTGQRPTAQTLSPSQSSLDAKAPQSTVGKDFIEKSLPATSEFNAIFQITPSAGGTTSSNGMGLGEAKTTLRGFKDGEYNISLDGIPFGDTNNPTHHSTSFFPASTLETVTVERGPGNAANLGQATFGGTIQLSSLALADTFGVSERANYGSWNTYNSVTALQTGKIDALGGANALFMAHEIGSDGYLTESDVKGSDQMVKFAAPVGDWVFSGLATHDWNTYYQPDSPGITRTQAATFGKQFALTTNPLLETNKDYNFTRKQTWFSYLRAEGDVTSNLHFQNTAYYYWYKNQTLSALDTTGATAQLVTLVSGGPTSFGIPGYTKLNQYSVYGDIAKAIWDTEFGKLTGGVWWETASTDRSRINFDLITGGSNYSQSATPASAPRNINYLQHSSWDQLQFFAEYEIHPTENVTVTPGLKYIKFERTVHAPVNQTSRAITDFTDTWKTPLPFLTVNWKMNENMSMYVQYAKGFLAPDLNTTYVANPTLNSFEPQRSTNYQLGFVYSSSDLTFDADIYEVDFINKVVSVGSGATQHFENIGGAKYSGVEAEVTYALMDNMVVFANGSLNHTQDNTFKADLATAPRFTYAGGFVFDLDEVRVSLLHKVTGTQFARVTSGALLDRIDAYAQTDLSASYTYDNLRFEAGVYNIFDNQDIVSISGSNPVTQQLQFQAGRSVQVGVKAAF